MQRNPRAPLLNAMLRLHRERQPIRLVTDYKQAFSLKVAKFTANWIKQNLELPYLYNVRISLLCANEYKTSELKSRHKMVLLDTTSLYNNIPSKKVFNTLR
jgi:hypothetical protein